MTPAGNQPDDSRKSKRPFVLLEQVAATVLLLVIVAIGWMIAAASQSPIVRLPSLELEVLVVLGLLIAALVLVSVVALRQTRE